MSKIDPTIKKETGYIAITVLILSALMEAVYLIIGRWELGVLLGNLLGGGVGILNFFLMGMGLQSALNRDEKGAKATVSFSHTMRFMLLAGVLVLAYFVDIFKLLPTVLALFFPSIGVYIKTFLIKNKGKDAT